MDSATSELRFGPTRLNAEQRQLLIGGQPAKLGARAFDVLLALVERRDRAVSKNELFELVWPGVVVEENNLQVHISTLRKLLGPQAIATIPGRGYRFTASVDASSSDAAPATEPAPAAPPTASTIRTNLPTHQEPLYGRADDISAVGDLLRKHAHVSIVGAGGIGKTRLALAVAAAQLEHFPDGRWWVELAALSDGALVAGAIGQALGVRAGNERPVLETAVALLRNKTALLVLDNCEHLQDAVAECVRTLLSNALALRILVTSQEALRTPGEQVYRLGSLPIASAGAADASSAAVELFVARAQTADPRLTLTAAGLETVAEICHRLDGIPLAIELAAARVRLLGIEGLHARLDERFHILTGGTRAVLRRHQTLRAALDWSYGLLSLEEQTVFRRLGVFVGGFTLELAQEIAADDHIDRWAVLDLLGHLVDKSLVVADGDQLPRYRLLETMRTFALEKLAATDETQALLRRHAEALLAFLLDADEQRWTSGVAESNRHGAELDNLRAALSWAASPAGDQVLACALIGSSRRIWLHHHLLNEGIERALRLLPLPQGLATEIEASFNLMLGGTLGYLGARRECFHGALRAAELYRSLRNTPRRIDALIAATQVGSRLAETKPCADALAEAEALIDLHAPPRQAAALALARAVYHQYLDQYEQAVESALRQAAFYRANGDEWGVQLALINVAWYECGLGRFDAAIAQLRPALETLRRIQAPHGIGMSLAFLAGAHALRGDRDEALANGRAAVPHLQRSTNVSSMLLFVALVHARHGNETIAAHLLGYYDSEMSWAGWVNAPLQASVRDEILQRAHAGLGPEEVWHQMTAGAALTEEQALGLAFDAEACRNGTNPRAVG